jgi:hypothetical protein
MLSGISIAIKSLAFGSIVKAASKKATDHIISKNIHKYLDRTRISIRKMYENYWKNMLVSGGLNVLIIITALLSFFVFSVNHIAIIIISLLSLALIIQMLILTIKNIVKAIHHIGDILTFLKDMCSFKSVPATIRELIRYKYRGVYYQNTNDFTRTAHGIFSTFGMVKSSDKIEEEVVDEYYSLVKDYLLRIVLSQIAIATIFYGFFLFFLRNHIFAYTMKMNLMEILLYPFTISKPIIGELWNTLTQIH